MQIILERCELSHKAQQLPLRRATIGSLDLGFVLVVLVQFDLNVINEVHHVLDHRLLLSCQVAVHFVNLQACVSIDLLSYAFAWSDMLKKREGFSDHWQWRCHLTDLSFKVLKLLFALSAVLLDLLGGLVFGLLQPSRLAWKNPLVLSVHALSNLHVAQLRAKVLPMFAQQNLAREIFSCNTCCHMITIFKNSRTRNDFLRFLASPTLSAAFFSADSSCWIPAEGLVILFYRISDKPK